jgi:hypothetical protein
MTAFHKIQIMAHFRRGHSLTARESSALFGKDRLAARIQELREDGHDILTTPELNANGGRHGRYSLITEKEKPNG